MSEQALSANVQLTDRREDRGKSVRCLLCGDEFTHSGVEAIIAWGGMEGGATEWRGPVCLECLCAGREGVAVRVRRHVEALRQRADDLESVVSRLQSGVVWPDKDRVTSALRDLGQR
jgi:hypothetical protein